MKKFKISRPKMPKLDVTRRMIKLARGSISTATLKKTRKRVRGTRVKNVNPELQASMEKEGITGFMLYYIIQDGKAHIVRDPEFEVDLALFEADAEKLVALGFNYIELQVGWDSYRIIEMEFDDERVRAHLEANPTLLMDKKLADDTKEALKVE